MIGASLPTGSWYPSAVQRELLGAILLPREEAARSLARWRVLVALDDLDPGSFGLLPMLARRLGDLGSDHPDDDRLRGVHKMTWAANQQLLSVADAVVAELGDHGIPVMITKGLPLALQTYGSISARRMVDVDLVVHREQHGDALQVLAEKGLTRLDKLPRTSLDRAVAFRTSNDVEIDLQWRMLAQCDLAWFDERVWSRSLELPLRRVSARCPSAGDMLFHVLVHGAVHNPFPPVRWIVDAHAVINRGLGDADWDALVSNSIDTGLVLPVGEALTYINQLVGLDVPPAVTSRLTSEVPERWRRIEYRLAKLPLALRMDTVTAYVGESRALGRRATPLGALRMLRDSAGFGTYRSLGRASLRKAGDLRDLALRRPPPAHSGEGT